MRVAEQKGGACWAGREAGREAGGKVPPGMVGTLGDSIGCIRSTAAGLLRPLLLLEMPALDCPFLSLLASLVWVLLLPSRETLSDAV